MNTLVAVRARQVAALMAVSCFARTALLAQWTPAPPHRIASAEFAERRERLARSGSEDVILVVGAKEPREDYVSFVQCPSLAYLTDVREPDAVLLGVRETARVDWALFVQPRDPAREVWTGHRTGAQRAMERWGIAGQSRADFEVQVMSALRRATSLLYIGDPAAAGEQSADPLLSSIRAAYPNLRITDGSSRVLQLRATKSPAELAQIRDAATITVRAMEAGSREIAAATPEYAVEAAVEFAFRAAGAERPAFASIVGSGPNATVLHYNTNDRVMGREDLVVVDIGASVHGYAADMTRTFPVSGRFSPSQRQLYQIVRDAQAAAERQARVGARARQLSDSAATVLAEGLTRLGLIESPNATYDCAEDGRAQCSQLSLYYMHGLGHGIGLEVHDPEQSDHESGVLGVGSAFTIEPGLYVREQLPELLPRTARNARLAAHIRMAVQRHANQGVRIEDDYLITSEGLEWITRGPREITEIERLLARRTVK